MIEIDLRQRTTCDIYTSHFRAFIRNQKNCINIIRKKNTKKCQMSTNNSKRNEISWKIYDII